MANHNDLGKKGEELAVNYLKSHGFEILDVNWKFSKTEIDVIAKKDKELIIIEVKTRSNINFGFPEEAVNFAKQERIFNATNHYVEVNELDLNVRFDIISIIKEKKKYKVHHLENAFYPYNNLSS